MPIPRYAFYINDSEMFMDFLLYFWSWHKRNSILDVIMQIITVGVRATKIKCNKILDLLLFKSFVCVNNKVHYLFKLNTVVSIKPVVLADLILELNSVLNLQTLQASILYKLSLHFGSGRSEIH